ncbi:MAG: response regulator [Calditrichaeota bacterium]|nr:MAG: response regulator [Calditrichota bacterium]MBL1207383.1 response regulator [Calditrichota bacterium]NOG47215.1 response regulator [Calditrichota bacterium]
MAEKILIVDDNPSVLKLLNISLTKAGYEIVEAENGEEAFVAANENLPDLIISDIMMPQMDGLELCWMIRENSKVPMVPFIFLTSFDDPETEVKGFRAGADKYLNKPIERKDLLEKVQELLDRKKKVNDVAKTELDNKGFAGDLSDLSIVELVQMLNLNKKSGVLHIKADVDGEIYLKDGQLHAASCKGLDGEEAVYKLVEQLKGKFNFELSDVSIERNINNSTMNVIMEACRIMDESRLDGQG